MRLASSLQGMLSSLQARDKSVCATIWFALDLVGCHKHEVFMARGYSLVYSCHQVQLSSRMLICMTASWHQNAQWIPLDSTTSLLLSAKALMWHHIAAAGQLAVSDCWSQTVHLACFLQCRAAFACIASSCCSKDTAVVILGSLGSSGPCAHIMCHKQPIRQVLNTIATIVAQCCTACTSTVMTVDQLGSLFKIGSWCDE